MAILRRTHTAILISALGLAGCVAPGAGQVAPANPTSARVLRQIADEYSRQRPAADSQLVDVSQERARREAESARQLLRRLDSIERRALTHDEWLTLGILEHRLDQ